MTSARQRPPSGRVASRGDLTEALRIAVLVSCAMFALAALFLMPVGPSGHGNMWGGYK